MKAIEIRNFITNYDNLEASSFITLNENVPKPKLTCGNKKKKELLVKVLACSLSPGDINMMEGNLYFMHPSTGFPFIPGHDICGIVEDTSSHDSTFKKGDVIVADNGFIPVGGLAEYMIIPESETSLKPQNVNVVEAAASSSATTASNAVLDHVKEGHRVLILGGSGGVGTAAIQLAKNHAKAGYVATTTTQHTLCGSAVHEGGLGADAVIDYRLQNWYDIEEYQSQKFDIIIDTVGGGNYDNKAEKVLKSRKDGGEFIAVVGDIPKPNANTLWTALKFTMSLFLKPLHNVTLGRHLPKYTLLLPYDSNLARKQVLSMMSNTGELKIVLEDKSPYPFTKQGVCDAIKCVASGHAHGKVVITMT